MANKRGFHVSTARMLTTGRSEHVLEYRSGWPDSRWRSGAIIEVPPGRGQSTHGFDFSLAFPGALAIERYW